jgi:hypothetical protein
MSIDKMLENWDYFEDDKDVRFRTFHVTEKEDISLGIECTPEIGRVLAVSVPLNADKTKFKCQFSYLSPKDLKLNKINKTYGKFLALARLNSDKAIIFTKDKEERILDFLKNFMLQEADRKNIFWLKDRSIENIH